MTSADYYRILGLPVNSSMEQIKKAYRQKARLFHPDLNHSSDAKEKFISVTEAYEFLVANFDKIAAMDDEAYRQAMEDWRKYRQDRSKQKARVYAQASYSSFKKTQIYKKYKDIRRYFNYIQLCHINTGNRLYNIRICLQVETSYS